MKKYPRPSSDCLAVLKELGYVSNGGLGGSYWFDNPSTGYTLEIDYHVDAMGNYASLALFFEPLDSDVTVHSKAPLTKLVPFLFTVEQFMDALDTFGLDATRTVRVQRLNALIDE